MANTKSAAKRARQAPVRTARNKSVKTALKNRLKEFHAALESRNQEEITAKSIAVVSEFDKAAKRGVIHSNKADRNKRSVTRAIAALKVA